MKITIVGTGYVGLSLATLISKKHAVIAVDILEDKIKKINDKISPIADKEIEDYLKGNLNLIATTDLKLCIDSDYIIIATPTNYDPETQYFDTSSIESVINKVQCISPSSTIVIKSTIPIGYTTALCTQYNYNNVMYSPEFLREGKALYDNLHPSRIIVGVPLNSLEKHAQAFANLLKDCSMEPDTNILIMGSSEAESVKLFSNTYLAMRVAFFNELDTFAEQHKFNSREIISGVCLDPRIGNFYNNPSFGYGGYCLPKDTKQLLANYEGIPNSLIKAIVESNQLRKNYIVSKITEIAKPGEIIGVYRLVMKSGSDNFRESSIIDILKILSSRGYKIIIYEPSIERQYNNWKIENDLHIMCNASKIIIANRISPDIKTYKNKVLCRDIFCRD